MSWKKEVDGIEQRRRRAAELGGAEAIERQHERGRMTIRERIDALADRDSFREQGPIAGAAELDDDGNLVDFTPGNYVLGVAAVGGRRCVIGGEDFTLRGGSPTPAGLRYRMEVRDLSTAPAKHLEKLLDVSEIKNVSATDVLNARVELSKALLGDAVPLAAGHQYQVRLRGENAQGVGAWSAWSLATGGSGVLLEAPRASFAAVL